MSTTNGSNGSSPKGSIDNPYTQEEFNSMCDAGTWMGGYVEGMDYVFGNTNVTASWSGSDFDSHFWDSFPWDDPFEPLPDPWEPEPTPDPQNPSSPDENTPNNENPPHTEEEPNSSSENGSSSTIVIGKKGYRYYINPDGTYTCQEDNNIGYDSINVGGYTLPISNFIPAYDKHGTRIIAPFAVYGFLADNTNVEWAASFNEDGSAYINTTNQHNKVDIPLMPNYTCIVHSHPEGTDLSDEDIRIYSTAFKNKDFHYKKFFLYRNGVLEDKTDYIK